MKGLACPRCGGSTVRDGDELWCVTCGSQPTPLEVARRAQVLRELPYEQKPRPGKSRWRRPVPGGRA